MLFLQGALSEEMIFEQRLKGGKRAGTVGGVAGRTAVREHGEGLERED